MTLPNFRTIFVLLMGGAFSLWPLCPGARGQQSGAGQNEAQGKIRVNSNLVVLPVTVKDKNGNLVPDMDMQDFRVFDDDVEQVIEVFTTEAFPLSLVVLVDDDLKSKDAAALVASLRSVTAGISLGDEALVCRFDLEVNCPEKFTNDEDILVAQLKNAKEASAPSKTGAAPVVNGPDWHPAGVGEPAVAAPVDAGSRPTKALDDAVYAAAQLLHDRERSRRKIILLISDGINGAIFNHHTYEETVELLLHENISVYGLAIGSDSFRKRFSRMRDYADSSGGDLYYASKSDAMERLYAQMTEQARHEYTLAYVPRGNNGKSDYHVIRVSSVEEGLSVKTRKGYYAGVGSMAGSSDKKNQ
ncbi:MAG: VWA domain-containing protein [Candidatus Acidiferrum sp.]